MAYKMLDEGVYRGEIKRWDFGVSANGTPYFEIQAHLTEFESEPGSDEFLELKPPTTRTKQFYLSAKSLDISMRDIRSLGFKDADLSRLHPDYESEDGTDKGHDLSGVVVKLKVQHEEYPAGSGKLKERIELVRSGKKLDLAGLSALDSISKSVATWQAKQDAAETGQPRKGGLFDKSDHVNADGAEPEHKGKKTRK